MNMRVLMVFFFFVFQVALLRISPQQCDHVNTLGYPGRFIQLLKDGDALDAARYATIHVCRVIAGRKSCAEALSTTPGTVQTVSIAYCKCKVEETVMFFLVGTDVFSLFSFVRSLCGSLGQHLNCQSRIACARARVRMRSARLPWVRGIV